MDSYMRSELLKAKDYALSGYDIGNDMYYYILRACRETSDYDELGVIARGILYTLKKNDWRQLRYVSCRSYDDEEYYASKGYYLF